MTHTNQIKQKQLSPDFSLPELKLTGDWSDCWKTRWATRQDVVALQDLFRVVFGHEMTQARWEWKYQDATAWGSAVEREGMLVGFYGGMPRLCVLKNQSFQVVQIGDVMVSPNERSAGRSGPLMRAAASYIDNMPSLYKDFAFAFGFPSERAMRLGVALGLYQPVEAINEIVWTGMPKRMSFLKKSVYIHKDAISEYRQQINALWEQMRHDFSGYILPVRDFTRWFYRYGQHPDSNFQLVLISSRFSNKPLAAFVIVEHTDHIELVDYVGGSDGINFAVEGARMCAARLGKSFVKGWFTNSLVPLFKVLCKSVAKTGIQVPIDLRGRSKAKAVLPAPLWLMAGDSDFR